MVRALLLSDLQRQYDLEDRTQRASLLGVLCRLFHPRFLPIVICRMSRAAFIAGVPVIPQLLTYANIVLFGIEITPRCEIGPGVFFPHTSGTVVGAWRIGAHVTIFQNVTLGSTSLDLGFDACRRPEVGDGVVLGAGSKILGGIRIGDRVKIGANSVVLHSVEADSVAVGVPAKVISKTVPDHPW